MEEVSCRPLLFVQRFFKKRGQGEAPCADRRQNPKRRAPIGHGHYGRACRSSGRISACLARKRRNSPRASCSQARRRYRNNGPFQARRACTYRVKAARSTMPSQAGRAGRMCRVAVGLDEPLLYGKCHGSASFRAMEAMQAARSIRAARSLYEDGRFAVSACRSFVLREALRERIVRVEDG